MDTGESVMAAMAFKRRGESLDVMEVASFVAAMESAQYWVERISPAPAFANDMELFVHAARQARPDGLMLEFGTATGRTLRAWAKLREPGLVYGFDTFQGLPEDWRSAYHAGRFAQETLPDVPANARLVQGLFKDTLPGFLAEHEGDVTLLHVDCDLYSSTRDVLTALAPRLPKRAVIVFHEYFNYPGWQAHEFRAFQEFLAQTGRAYAYVGFVPSHQQVAVMLDP